MDVQSLGYRTDLAIRAAEGSQLTDCGDHIIVRSEQNPGYWWGNFILLAEPPSAADLATWLARFAEVFPAAAQLTLGVDVTTVAAVDPAVFTAAGMRMDHDAVLTASAVREPPHPNRTARIRRLAGDADWRQSTELRRACNAAEASEPAEDGDFVQRRSDARRQLAETGHGVWFGAFDGGRLVAQLGLVTVGGRLARYQDVETRPDHRRQGLAGTLVWHAARHGLAELGVATLVMVADPGYPAIRIYESVGFSRTEDQVGFARH